MRRKGTLFYHRKIIIYYIMGNYHLFNMKKAGYATRLFYNMML